MRSGNFARWGLIGVFGLALVACESSREAESEAQRARQGPWQIDDGSAREPDVRERLGRLRAARPDEPEDAPRDTSLTGPEIYRGSGVLARDPGLGSVDVVLGDNGKVTLNFANAEIRDVLDVVLGETLDLSYIIDPAVQGSITVRTSKPLTREAVIPALENILALNGVAMTLVDDTYMIVPQEVAARELSTPLVAPSDSQFLRGFGVTVIPLNYASATSMLEVLEPFIGPGSLRADESRNLLIYSGRGRQARDLMEMVDVFDVDWMRGMSFALFPLEVADVKTLITDLETVFLQDGKSPLAGLVRFAPIERLNAVLAISPQPAYLERAQIWIERLDRGAEGAGRRIFVYYVENGRAEDLAKILSEVFEGESKDKSTVPRAELAPGLTPVELGGSPTRRTQTTQTQAESTGQEPARQTQPAPQPTRRQSQRIQQSGVGQAIGGLVQESGDIRVIADEANNALVILATVTEFRMIEATLKKLDIVPLQVLIEATIAEVRLNDTLQYGVQWFFERGDVSGAFSPFFEGSADTLTETLAGAVFPGFSFISNTNEAKVVLNALTSVTDVKVISSPQLMVLDNQTARLQVGDQVPFVTQSISPTDEDTLSTVQQIDTGVILEVTPRVNAGGLVTLEIAQEVSNPVTGTDAQGTPTISQRKIESTIAVQSGETIALGGLIRDNTDEGVTGVPLLSEIPILGHLFKTTTEFTERTELLVLITPQVVRNQVESRKVTEELRRRLKVIEPLEQKIRPPKEPSS